MLYSITTAWGLTWTMPTGGFQTALHLWRDSRREVQQRTITPSWMNRASTLQQKWGLCLIHVIASYRNDHTCTCTLPTYWTQCEKREKQRNALLQPEGELHVHVVINYKSRSWTFFMLHMLRPLLTWKRVSGHLSACCLRGCSFWSVLSLFVTAHAQFNYQDLCPWFVQEMFTIVQDNYVK